MGCPAYPDLDLDAWGNNLLASLEGRRYPLTGSIELTSRCNLNCLHCYINEPASSPAALESELTTNQIVGIIDQVAEAGCLSLVMTGGEVLLRRDFPEIYTHALQRGLLITIFTNGTLLTPHSADLLADSRPLSIEVTVYGASQGTYEQVTRVPGSYARFRRGVDLLLERGLTLILKTVLLTVNRGELHDMKASAESLGLPFRYDGTLFPRLDGSRLPLVYQISLQELATLDREDPERLREWRRMDGLTHGQMIRSEYVYNCGAGHHSFHINYAGWLSPCTMICRPVYDLHEMSFNTAWEHLGEMRNQKRRFATACRTCSAGALCTQCPAWSQAIHGDDETPVEFICELGRQRTSQVRALPYA